MPHIKLSEEEQDFFIALTPHDSRDGIEAAFRATPGAEGPAEIPSGTFEFRVHVTPANIAALWATGWQWDIYALHKSLEVVMPILQNHLRAEE